MSKYLALCKLSKSDLIWIIDRLLDTGCWPTGDYYLDQALSDLKHERISLICVKRTNMLRLRIKSGWNTVIW